MASSKQQKADAARAEIKRIQAQKKLIVVNGEVVSREDLDPEPGEERQYRRQFPQNFHE